MSVAQARAVLTARGAPFEMREERIREETFRTYVHAKPGLRTLLDESRSFADQIFLVYEEERITFEDHWRAANVFGRVLTDKYSVKKGDRVALAMRNFPEWSVCAFGAWAIGAIVVPLNAWETSETLARMIIDCEAVVTVVDSERRERLGGQGHGSALVSVRDDGGPNSFEHLVAPASEWSNLPEQSGPDCNLAPDDPAMIMFTSGTTGAPKGALCTHRAIMTNLVNTQYRVARAAIRRGESWPPPPADTAQVMLMPLPLFHATGLLSGLVPSLARGMRLVLMYRWELETALSLIEKERVNILVLVPALVVPLLERIPEGGCPALRSVHTVTYGGSPASADLAEKVQSRFPGAVPAQGYGATETTSLVASNSHEELIARPDSVGVAVPCCDIRVVDENDNDVVPGEAGELWVRGPQVFQTYWRRDEATRAVKRAGWYRTGDIVTVDEEGFIYVKDRKKDMVIRGGENIYCAEIEDAIGRIPGVIECAVFGMPDRVMGEIVAGAVVVRTEGALTALDVKNRLAAELPAFKIPEALWIGQDALPRNAAGKVVKGKLRDDLLANFS